MNICIICLEKCNININECQICDIIICKKCIIEWYNEKQEKICPICKNNIYNDKYIILNNIINNTNNNNNNDNNNNNNDINNLNNIIENEYLYCIRACILIIILIILYLYIYYYK